jgi:hypothetical protein
MVDAPAPDFAGALRVLAQHHVEFLVVGGVGAALAGALIATADLDVLYRRTRENAQRLAQALRAMDAIYRDPAGRRVEPDASRLLQFRISLLVTRFGYVDALAEIGPRLGYDDLVGRSSEIELQDFRVRSLDLEAIIETKEFSDRPKDRAVLDVLREALRIRRERGES